MPQEILYFRTTIKILPVLVRLVVADKPLFTVTGNGPLRHAQKLRKVTVIQQGVAVQAVFQAVHTVKFLFKAIKTFHHSHDHFLKYLIIYIHHGISSIVLKSDYLNTLPVRTTRVYYTIMKITCRIQKNESIFLHNILIHKEI